MQLFGVAKGLRMMAVAPNGDLFVSDTRTGKIYVMPDRDGDGMADQSSIFAEDLQKPHGLAFHKGYLYVATETAVLRFPYADGQLRRRARHRRLLICPSGPAAAW